MTTLERKIQEFNLELEYAKWVDNIKRAIIGMGETQEYIKRVWLKEGGSR